MLTSSTIESPVGSLTLVASDKGLVAVLWPNDREGRVPFKDIVGFSSHPLLHAAERQLREYFEGQRTTFDLPLDLRGTPFQREVWGALLAIPFGERRTYRQIASQLGKPNATRAVGAANGRNPVSIVVPCHRVVGSSGTLTGFAGGMSAKAYLLNLEASSTAFALTCCDWGPTERAGTRPASP